MSTLRFFEKLIHGGCALIPEGESHSVKPLPDGKSIAQRSYDEIIEMLHNVPLASPQCEHCRHNAAEYYDPETNIDAEIRALIEIFTEAEEEEKQRENRTSQPEPIPEPVEADNEPVDDIQKSKFSKLHKPEEKQFVKVHRVKTEGGYTDLIEIDLSAKQSNDSLADEIDYQQYKKG